jgi:outer membrane protein OmpA-like peptidoglycan-associated protein
MRYRGAMLATALFATPLATAMLAAPQTAMAQPIQGPYISGGVGLLMPQDPKITPLSRGFGSGTAKLDEGYGFDAMAALGYGLGNGFRLEVEGDFNRAGVRHLLGTGFPSATGGHVRTYGVMGNAIYDMDIGMPWLYPYLGLGAGYQWTNLNNVTSVQAGGPFTFSTNARSGAFAWQAIAGVSLPVPGVPGLSGTIDYRFMDILGGEKFGGASVLTAGGPPVPAAIKLHNQFDHSIMFGIRYAFNTPAPAPVVTQAAPAPEAAPAPAPARSYLVFFDWDKATLTDRARAIIKEAADNSTHVQYTRIDVNGYTDTSGTPRYNQGLSIRRAQAVAGELVRDGVPQNAITAQGFGDTHLLVPTGPNVREPQNRRVEIVIH